MGINDIYSRLLTSDPNAEKELFQKLTVSFSLFVEQRIQDEFDAQEVVQESLVVIARKFRDIEISTSFSAWAYKTLEYELLHYYLGIALEGTGDYSEAIKQYNIFLSMWETPDSELESVNDATSRLTRLKSTS